MPQIKKPYPQAARLWVWTNKNSITAEKFSAAMFTLPSPLLVAIGFRALATLVIGNF